MSDALELQVLVAVGAGRRTLDALSRTLRVPAPAVDERIRRAIGEGLLVARQQDGTWVFDLTEAGRQLVATRARAGAGPAPSGGPAGLVSAMRTLISQAPGVSAPSAPWPAALQRRRATPSSQPTSPPTSSPMSGTTHLLSPTEEAQRAERAAWSLAIAVVGAVVVLVLLAWLLAAR